MKKEHWRKAMQQEIQALEDNGTWTLEIFPPDKKALRCIWLYKIKYNSDGPIERYKTRLVIFENKQEEGIDYNETFAPVAKIAMTSFVMLIFLLLTFWFLNSSVSFGQAEELSIGDRIDTNKTITIGVTIISSSGNFEFGFFTPNNGTSYYIGTWYKNISPQTVIWVANRDSPLSFSEMPNAEFAIRNGNLVLLNGTRQLVWSTKVNSRKSDDSMVAVLGDDGNFALRDGNSNSTSHVLWQSFDHPSHTFMPGARFSYNKNTQAMQYITSWRSSDDPSPGPYTVEFNPTNGQFRAMWKRTEEYWNSGAWDGDSFRNVPYNTPNTTVNYTYVNNDNEVYYIYTFFSPLVTSRFVIDVTGEMKQFTWLDSSKQWNVVYLQPTRSCDVYAYCGAFGTCNPNSTSVCRCLPGFVPKLDTDWDLDIFSQGCVRKTNLSCGSNPSAPFKDKFWLMSNVTLPKYYETARVTSATKCESACLNNCSCTAYAYDGTECLTWSEELLNLQQLSQDDQRGRNLFIKLAASDFPSAIKAKPSWSTRLKVIVLATVCVTILVVNCFIYIYCRRRIAKGKGQRNFLAHLQSRDNLIALTNEDDENSIDAPFFSFESILAATNQFSEANMLGRGGFGPVYKGKFPGGREIAVKRLSTQSRQGIEEFTNEVLLIARVQHRNLVKLLGYCVKGDEKILLYEYMLNKSLDTFIFDQQNCTLLDWKKRFDIILGIARGMSYLHHDSRLTIIHRDLKTSNILLDEGMNPKISDFGLARIVQGDYTRANTTKIAGTCGYMSPEYALNGSFSTKSDVFSFGVILLEIVSGRKSTGFHQYEEAINLIEHVWKLWEEEKEINLVDESLRETCKLDEAIRCINIGLLCVQENPCQRPSMSNVIVMLGGESMILPRPNQPAFVTRSTISSKSTTSSSTNNGLTITIEQGR
ncbi:G-type lectin S-receptor-like serine/threonine-protein kinase At4g27290 [Lycium ferocissimum]|uniref:G-type lectin S-receptor-like serine/threonine-protein kinase At4g27290 n=1 Tax=Lycium ferocissimum TaxID=112874 RepID=UPI002814CB2B|nr:G-type lectin S-receptor-like serine/threonine-protein kinase At4g27290 [Lycium ferocissimum]